MKVESDSSKPGPSDIGAADKAVPALYWSCVTILRLIFSLVYRARIHGAHNVPLSGPVLLAANHESHFDPPFIGCFLKRRLSYIARAGLFRNPAFGRFIGALGSVPVREDGGDLTAMRQTIAYLKQGRAILIFPEGSRSHDGELQEFKRGVFLLLSRAECTIVPVAVSGIFEAWPRRRKLPSLFGHRFSVRYGEPIDSRVLAGMKATEGLAYLKSRIRTLRDSLESESIR